jgi:hypothetical protein
MESELLRFYVAAITNDHIKQDHSGFLTPDAVRQTTARRSAVVADPTHALARGKDHTIRLASSFL